MTDHEARSHAKKVLAAIADRITEFLLGEQTLRAANETLVLIREEAQDAAFEMMDALK